MKKDVDKEKELAAKEAVKLIRNNQIVGLGTGSTAAYAIREIGILVKNGLTIKAVATSNATTVLATSLNIPLINVNEVNSIDITIDGADEFTSGMLLIKGGGGALIREKIVASLSREEIIIADSSKQVAVLGKFELPIAVVPFAVNYVLNQLTKIAGKANIRTLANGALFITDEGNLIVDANFGLIENPILLSDKLNNIEGIVGHGLFIGLASKIIMGSNNGTIIFSSK